MFQTKFLTVTFIGRCINGKYSFVKSVKAEKFNISKDKISTRLANGFRKKKTRSQSIKDCFSFTRTLVKLVTCGFTKCGCNVGFYGLLNDFSYKTRTCIKTKVEMQRN